jgi:hypothetical protein
MQNLVVELQAYAIDLLVGVAIVLAAGLSLRILRALGAWTPENYGDPREQWQSQEFSRKGHVFSQYPKIVTSS